MIYLHSHKTGNKINDTSLRIMLKTATENYSKADTPIIRRKKFKITKVDEDH